MVTDSHAAPLSRPPKVSVAMITYNHEKLITQAIESVLSQRTDFPIELVIGEDCSTDRTRVIVEAFASKFPGIVRLLPPAPNMGSTMNFARTIMACSGQYSALLEGDDYWTDPEKLRLQVEYLEAHPDCVLSHHKVSYLRDETGEVIQEFPPLSRREERADAALLADSNFIQTCSVVFRRKDLPKLSAEFMKLKLGDLPLCAMLGQHGWFGYLDRNMGVYRIHGSNYWYAKPERERARAGHDMARFLAKSLKGSHQGLWATETLSLSRNRLRDASRDTSFKEFAGAFGMLCSDTIRFKLRFLPRCFAYIAFYTLRFAKTIVRRSVLGLAQRQNGARAATGRSS